MHRHVRNACFFALLLAPGIGTAQQSAATPVQERFWDAAISGDTVALARALAEGAVLDSLDTRQNENGRRALNWAAWYDHVDAVRFLLRRGAALEGRNRTWNTPLHHAAEAGSVGAVRVLLVAGADPTAINVGGSSPADVARRNFHPEAVALIDSAATARRSRSP